MEEQRTLSIDDVTYDEKYRLSKAATTQVIKGMQMMIQRIGEPTNSYQQELYPPMRNIVTRIVDSYNRLLNVGSTTDFEVRRYNLHGYNGIVSGHVYTRGVKRDLFYKYANFGDLMKTLKQRAQYIVEREAPKRYQENASEMASFQQLQTELKSFVEFLVNEIEPSWTAAVTAARASGGVEVEENLKKRAEEAEKRRQERETRRTQQEGRPQRGRGNGRPYQRRENQEDNEGFQQVRRRRDVSPAARNAQGVRGGRGGAVRGAYRGAGRV